MEMSPQTRAQLSSGTHYYWYKGNKIPITINTTKSYILFESSDEANLQLPLLNSKSGLSAAKVTLSSRLQLQDATRSAANDNLYWAEVATADVNAQDKALVYSAPYFKTSDGADLGLSHLFYVKVKSIRDVRILTTLATENKVTLLGNNEYLPLWYTLSCTNESLGNALEMANKFYEDGPFAACQPCFISEDEMGVEEYGAESRNCRNRHQLSPGQRGNAGKQRYYRRGIGPRHTVGSPRFECFVEKL